MHIHDVDTSGLWQNTVKAAIVWWAKSFVVSRGTSGSYPLYDEDRGRQGLREGVIKNKAFN